MGNRKTGKEITENMEYLVALLHQEWEQSGRTEVEAVISVHDVPEIGKRVTEAVAKRQEQTERGEMGFKQSMYLSRENFVLLRLMRKIKEAKDMAGNRKSGVLFSVELDKEEYSLFSVLVKEQGA